MKMNKSKTVVAATPQQIEDTFAEWIRRYRAHPEQFLPPDETLLQGTPEITSKLAAPYFIQLLAELQGARKPVQSILTASLFIVVPERMLPDGTVVPSFNVGQYHCARVDGKAVVSRELKPVVNINYHDSIKLCRESGYEAITETQELSIAYDIAGQDINWTGGKVGVGKIIQGLHKGTVSGVQAGDYESPDPEERRWHQLSNGSLIFDFAGHLFSWVRDNVQGNDDGTIARPFAKDSISLQAPYPSMTKGVGWRPNTGADWSGHALLRGGCWIGGDAGVFSLSNVWTGNECGDVGVRCTRP